TLGLVGMISSTEGAWLSATLSRSQSTLKRYWTEAAGQYRLISASGAGGSIRSLLPNHRVTPQKMLPVSCTWQNLGAQFADLAKCWVGIILLVRSPGGANFTRRKQTAVVKKSQADARRHRYGVQN